jgi:hypothetical protein
MRMALVRSLIICAALSVAPVTLSAQPALQAPSRINSPTENQVVRGTLPIVGTAVDADFWKYEVYYAPEPNPGGQWIVIGEVQVKQVVEGLLETWYTESVPDGTYNLRLRVVNRTGNYRDIEVRGIRVANAAPTETPTPTQTPPATATITPAATPTFIIPTSPLAQPTATPTLARPNRSVLPEVLDLNSWRRSFCTGAQLMAGFLIVLGFVFLLRRRL